MLAINIKSRITTQLKNSQPFIFPTETVYGLGAAASNQLAIERIYALKNRPRDNPLICHFHSLAQISNYIDLDVTPEWWVLLARKLSPGPVTYFLPVRSDSLLQPALAGSNKAGCRIPNHTLALDILRYVDVPIAAPSANTSGIYSATHFEMIQADLGSKVSLCIDGGQSVIGIESTTIDCTDPDEIVIYRPGFISREDLVQTLRLIGREDISVRYSKDQKQETSPGMKYRHYQPLTPIRKISYNVLTAQIKENLEKEGGEEAFAFLIISDRKFAITHQNYIHLPLDLSTIASQLYASLFALDKLQKQAILCYLDPEIDSLRNDSLYKGVENRLAKILP